MNLYEKYVLPQLVHYVCGMSPNMRQRAKVVPEATGIVLEIGIGSGHNLTYYDANKVKNIIGIDPSPAESKLMLASENINIPFEFIRTGAEVLDFENDSIDTVVSTYTFCTIPDISAALQEIKRVLKPGGKILFVEHGKAPDPAIQKTQNKWNPLWRRVSGGCHINRDIVSIIENEGFIIHRKEELYLPGWKPATFNTSGHAEPL